MKRTFLILGICAVIAACGSNSEKQADVDTTSTTVTSTDIISGDSTSVTTPDTVATDHTATSKETKVAETVIEEKQEAPAKPVEKKVAKAEPKKEVAKADNDIEDGKGLVSKSDCMACHKLDIKIVGPAYIDVAKKYKPTDANIEYLADKIIKGGAGVWGEIPMSPHPGVSADDAKKMAKYVLSIK